MNHCRNHKTNIENCPDCSRIDSLFHEMGFEEFREDMEIEAALDAGYEPE